MKNLKNLTLTLMAFLMSGILLFSSCKKDDKENTPAKLTEAQINKYAESATNISTQMQASAASFLSKAIEEGFTGLPAVDNKKSGTVINGTATDGAWLGPDAQGWYYRTWKYMYTITEKVRTRKDTVDHVYITESDDASGSFKMEIATQYVKYLKNNKELYKGFCKIDTHSSGYNEISRSNWEMDFKDWDPKSGAGIYDWYWGVSENNGGYTVPTHHYLHIEATPTTNNWLHVRVKIYDDKGVEVWDFEYDTPFEPVEMPEK